MMGFFKKLFKPSEAELLVQQGKAHIVDVRTPGEYKSGHVKGSVNIPLNQFQREMKALHAKEHVVLCCASGMRSAQASSILKSSGHRSAHNGGSWHRVNQWKKA